MLAKILEEMWVDPDLLEALSEEQKKVLFFKMREEQVRRWREREEGNNSHTHPKKASSKQVSWVLGHDGDVRVNVIGEEDEFRSSKLLRSLLNNGYHDACMAGAQKVALLPERRIQPQDPKPDTHLPPTYSESVTPNCCLAEEEEVDPSSAEEEQRESASDTDGDSESSGSLDNLNDWAPLYEPHLRSHGNSPPLRAQPPGPDGMLPLDRVRMDCTEEEPACRGRVAQLRKAFAPVTSDSSSGLGNVKPPVPIKPPHLQTVNHSAPQYVPGGIPAC